jgi:hypothetical protein
VVFPAALPNGTLLLFWIGFHLEITKEMELFYLLLKDKLEFQSMAQICFWGLKYFNLNQKKKGTGQNLHLYIVKLYF